MPIRQRTPSAEDKIEMTDMEEQNVKLKFETSSQNIDTELNLYKPTNFLEVSSNESNE